jgi:hypothetical protein
MQQGVPFDLLGFLLCKDLAALHESYRERCCQRRERCP